MLSFFGHEAFAFNSVIAGRLHFLPLFFFPSFSRENLLSPAILRARQNFLFRGVIEPVLGRCGRGSISNCDFMDGVQSCRENGLENGGEFEIVWEIVGWYFLQV